MAMPCTIDLTGVVNLPALLGHQYELSNCSTTTRLLRSSYGFFPALCNTALLIRTIDQAVLSQGTGPPSFFAPGTANCSIFPKSGVPSPVTGSHPFVALNPAPGITGPPLYSPSMLAPEHPWFLPVMMSLNAWDPIWYSHGFKNPRGGMPADSLASFSRAMMPANVGAAAEVPDAQLRKPLSNIVKSTEEAATSGKPRPWGLKYPLNLLPKPSKKAETASS